MKVPSFAGQAALFSLFFVMPFSSWAAHVACIDAIIAAYCQPPNEVKKVGFYQNLGGTPQPGLDGDIHETWRPSQHVHIRCRWLSGE